MDHNRPCSFTQVSFTERHVVTLQCVWRCSALTLSTHDTYQNPPPASYLINAHTQTKQPSHDLWQGSSLARFSQRKCVCDTVGGKKKRLNGVLNKNKGSLRTLRWRNGGRWVALVRRGCLLYLPEQFKSITIYGGADGIVVGLPTMWHSPYSIYLGRSNSLAYFT